MSLSKLFQDDDGDEKLSSTWLKERRKLIIALCLTSILSIVLVGFFFFFHKTEEPLALQKTDQIDQQNISYMKHLLELREEAKRLESESNLMASLKDVQVQRNRETPRSTARHRRPTPPKGKRLVDYEPGTDSLFEEINTETRLVYIPTGAVFQARLITPIKTSVQKSFVIAETTHEFRMDMKRRIPKSSRLIGSARLNPILKGVIVEFNTLVLPDGRETTVSGLALSRNALPEIEGLYFSDDLERYSTAMAFGFLSGFSNAAQEREPTIFGSQPVPSVGNQVLSGLSTASFEIADEMLREIKDRAVEYVVVPAGDAIFVALTSRYEIEQRKSK